MSNNRPAVGIGVFCLRRKDGRFLVGKRKSSFGSGLYALPGGHLELFEEWADCAAREIKEETGLTISNAQYVGITNTISREEGKHYIDIFMAAWVNDDAEPENLEPNKCEGWEWMNWEELHRQEYLFPATVQLAEQEKSFDPAKALSEAEAKAR